MPSQVRTVEYEIAHVNSLSDLIEMMRYDGMRFHSGSIGEVPLKMLMRRDLGIVKDRDWDEATVCLLKDQLNGWSPTFARWHSYGMTIAPIQQWHQARQIN